LLVENGKSRKPAQRLLEEKREIFSEVTSVGDRSGRRGQEVGLWEAGNHSSRQSLYPI
jgi:hypothetical protein